MLGTIMGVDVMPLIMCGFFLIAWCGLWWEFIIDLVVWCIEGKYKKTIRLIGILSCLMSGFGFCYFNLLLHGFI